MAYSETITWKDPVTETPPIVPVLAVVEKTAVKLGWAEQDEDDGFFYLFSEEDHCEGRINFWAYRPKTPFD